MEGCSAREKINAEVDPNKMEQSKENNSPNVENDDKIKSKSSETKR